MAALAGTMENESSPAAAADGGHRAPPTSERILGDLAQVLFDGDSAQIAAVAADAGKAQWGTPEGLATEPLPLRGRLVVPWPPPVLHRYVNTVTISSPEDLARVSNTIHVLCATGACDPWIRAPLQECASGGWEAMEPSSNSKPWANAMAFARYNFTGFRDMKDLGYLGKENGKPTCVQVITEACASGHASFVTEHPEWAKRQEIHRCGDNEADAESEAEGEMKPRGGSGPLGRMYAGAFEQLQNLHRAVLSIDVDGVKAALAEGADPNERDADEGKNALALLMNLDRNAGVRNENVTPEVLEIVRMLAAHGADPDKKWWTSGYYKELKCPRHRKNDDLQAAVCEGEREFASREPIEWNRRRILSAAQDGDWAVVRTLVEAVRAELLNAKVDSEKLRLCMRRLIDEPEVSHKQRTLGGVMRIALEASYSKRSDQWEERVMAKINEVEESGGSAAVLEWLGVGGGSLCDSFLFPARTIHWLLSECCAGVPSGPDTEHAFALLFHIRDLSFNVYEAMFDGACVEVENAAVAREQKALRDIMGMLIAKGLDPFGAGPCMDFSSTETLSRTPLGGLIEWVSSNSLGTQEKLRCGVLATVLEEMAALGMDSQSPYTLDRHGSGTTLLERMAPPPPLSVKKAKSKWDVDDWKKKMMRSSVQREAVARGQARLLAASGETSSVAVAVKPQLPTAPSEPQLPAAERKSPCSVCGTLTKNKCLRYHKPGARLAPYAWTHGVTYEWRWSCCNFVENLTESIVKRDGCYHPNGCNHGICDACRQPCPCMGITDD